MLYLKRTMRSVLLPVLGLITAVFGAVYIVVNDNAIQKNTNLLQKKYDTFSIECTVVPESIAEGDLSFSPFDGETVTSYDEVIDYYGYMQIPAFLWVNTTENDREATAGSVSVVSVFGTNRVDRLASEAGLTIAWADNYNGDVFENSRDICLLDDMLCTALGCELGDTVFCSIADEEGNYDNNAPSLTFIIAGVYHGQASLYNHSVIIPEKAVFQRDELSLAYNDQTRRAWYQYRFYSFFLDPICNYDYEPVIEMLRKRLSDMGSYYLHANTKDLEDAIKPIENSLSIQRKLSVPIMSAFALVFSVIVALYVLKNKMELLVRRMNGEKATSVFIREWGYMLVLICILFLPAAGIMTVTNMMREWIGWVLAVLASSITISGLILMTLCNMKLVSLYQQKE